MLGIRPMAFIYVASSSTNVAYMYSIGVLRPDQTQMVILERVSVH